MSQQKGPNGWVLFAVFGGLLVALIIGGLAIRGIGFGPLLILFDRPSTAGPVTPDFTDQPAPTSAPPPPSQPAAASLPPAYRG